MSLQINRTNFRGANAAQVATSFPNPYSNPDPSANGTLPTPTFPNGVFTTPVPSSPVPAANSNTLTTNLIYQITNFSGGNVNIAYYQATQSRYVVHGNQFPWQTMLVNPGMRWDIIAEGTIQAPIPANASPDPKGSDHTMIIWNLDPDPVTNRPMMWEFWTADIKGGTWECNCMVRSPTDVGTGIGTSAGSSFTAVYPWAYDPEPSLMSGTGASHMSYAGGLITVADCLYGAINHALYFSITETGSLVAPATQHDGNGADVHGVPEGTRFYFPPSVQMPNNLPLLGQMSFQAMKTYGFYICDTTDSSVTATMEHNVSWKNFQGTYYPSSLLGTPDYSTLNNLPWTQAVAITPMSDLAIVSGYTVPTAPTLSTPTPGTSGSGQVTLNWTTPSSSGTSSITGYSIYYGTTSNGQAAKVQASVSGGSTLTDTLTLTSGTTYYFKVCATTTDPGSTGVNGVNNGSTGASSNEVSITAP
jgi:hypothetical protein